MAKLNKAFKCLHLKRSEGNKLEFKKREGVHDFKLRPFIQHFIDEIAEGKKEGSDDSESSEGESSELSEESEHEKKSKKHKNRKRSSSSGSSEESYENESS
jgi:hypothetical protein